MEKRDNTDKIKKSITIAAIACGIIVVCLAFVTIICSYKEKNGLDGIYYSKGDYFFPDDVGQSDEKLDNDFGEIVISRNSADEASD